MNIRAIPYYMIHFITLTSFIALTTCSPLNYPVEVIDISSTIKKETTVVAKHAKKLAEEDKNPITRTYTVKQGDTLSNIANRFNIKYTDIAQWNNLASPYLIKIGDTLILSAPSAKTITTSPTKNTLATASKPTWLFPSKGKIIKNFQEQNRNDKGIEIGGILGQEINAVADGKVIYIGTNIQTYGNLIIIKHDKDYLSVYAHNDKVLVKEKQNVIKGEKIAEMGSSGTNQVKLHFQARYKGTPIDPAKFFTESKSD